MAKNWAIAIGINQYDYLQPLNYAKRDAQLIQQFLRNEAGFDEVILFSDDSPDFSFQNRAFSSLPIRSNLRYVLLNLPQRLNMGAGDNFWFFFSGHGMRHAERDYLMPLDGNPADIEETAIPINFVTERLRCCGADNVVLILDACRNEGKKTGEGIGEQTAEQARQKGVISIFSCSPQEYSYEIEALQQGAFTTALLEGLGIRGQCATVERLNQYLNFRVPEIVRHHKNTRQTPYIIAEPVNKSHLILVPRYATLADIATLKNDAYRAKDEGNLDLAEQLWIRVLAAASGQDTDAIEAIKRIERLRWEPQQPVSPPPKPSADNSTKGASTVEKNPLKTFQFEVVTVDATAKITNRSNRQAKYFVEDLGNGVTLEMVQIAGGTFMMGSLETEAQRYSDESPQHEVKVPGFFMGKYQITQAQYQAIMGTNPANFKGEKRPVEQVNWDDAVDFCKKLSQKTGRTYRLPSEAEWEYACRAGTTTPFYFGETITTDLVNYDGNYPYGSVPKGEYRDQTTYVGKFPPNSFGLYDMHGNVWEWCQDVYNDNYQSAPKDSSVWLTGKYNNKKLLRGGSWHFSAGFCRCANRDYTADANRFDDVGFRVVGVA
ncbi:MULTISPECIES: SUMF1/EgtB/PvdO family nonheme iron enzyme [Nostoc]|uniref:SUMF1/EgtB/PvdO family nonheme iron enzyme n=1 Tax=Nostoc paludosum FACHB-159 TaxID=2692908 RepID=A0ABR8K9K4_9NOSO|nr:MULTISPECIES: SUMF1/EgtB/PvdO family nonheme iron enzyme [Nostoc]MBD2676783.1 SUMF1/EgtB/PvdO family nonheme iron enzyme [Nostoc sp. FACHB-857]MBD2734970.1 SUMF1/EgtB/PvdO family nonheme iron enzyme [Nostoc paludosum FACHB-159]